MQKLLVQAHQALFHRVQQLHVTYFRLSTTLLKGSFDLKSIL